MNKEVLLLIFLFLGMLGTFLPFIPGIPLMFISILIYSFFDNWVHLSPFFLIIIGTITIIAFFIDYFAAFWGVKRLGASKMGIWGGIFGSLIGLVFLGLMNPVGLLLGGFLGVLIGELLAGKELSVAVKISLGNVLGLLGSTLVQLVIALIIILVVIFKLY